ncbi:MAG: hypothetical protein HN402_07815, partial [Candidatus Scalindua sp.]|nr:hypothetical protein [Candidatus Scalindua sp.]
TITGVETFTVLKQEVRLNADGTDLGDFNSLQPAMVWTTGSGSSTCPTVDSIEYEFEYINN